MEIRNKNNAEHYLWGQNCEGWHLVATDDLSVIEERMLPHTAEIEHYHRRSSQCFYVLTGEIIIEAEGARFVLTEGDSIYVANKIVHKVLNPGSLDARFVVISSPKSHGDRIVVTR